MLPSRQYNIIIFGATGFTGKHVVEEIAKSIQNDRENTKSLSWAVAGRSLQKLSQVLEEVSKFTGEDFNRVDKIVADISDPDSLVKMSEKCNIIINAVGPYALYGEPVIKACLKTCTHYVDLTAESHNATKMQVLYNREAEEKGVYIVQSCGFDSIPNECGINYLEEKFNGDLNSVESYLYIGSHIWTNKINYGTWTSVLHFYADFNKLRPLLKELYPNELPKPKHKLNQKYLVHRNSFGENGYCIPFPHPDTWAVERSQNYFYVYEKKRPVQFTSYLKQSNIFLTLYVGIGALFLGLMLKFRCGVYLLDRFPRLFSGGLISREGPKREQMNAFDFSFTLIGKGWDRKKESDIDELEHIEPPNKTIKLKISGINPAYGATCTCLLQSALTLLYEFDKLPDRGGVYTPGPVFRKTTIVQRLHKNGLTFEII